MKRQNFLIICLMLFLFSGCTHRIMHHNPDLSHDVKAQESEVNKDGIRLRVKCIHLKSEMKTYFDEDLVRYGILPVQIYIQNKSYPRTVVFNIDGINLIDPVDAKNPIMSCEQIIEKMGWTQAFMAEAAFDVATLNPINFMVNPLIYSQIIKEAQSSYKSHSIKFGNLISGGVTEGFTFFSIPKDLNNLDGWKISVVLKDTETNNDIVLDYALSGSIVSPKERNSAVVDHDEMR